jgi:enamine deaminase RidA (YjgF/YER057c/UK114 family)
VVGEDIRAQAEQVMKNLTAVLVAAGSSPEKAVKTTCYLADMGDFALFNEVYATCFTTNPARSCVAVKTLPKGVLWRLTWWPAWSKISLQSHTNRQRGDSLPIFSRKRPAQKERSL